MVYFPPTNGIRQPWSARFPPSSSTVPASIIVSGMRRLITNIKRRKYRTGRAEHIQHFHKRIIGESPRIQTVIGDGGEEWHRSTTARAKRRDPVLPIVNLHQLRHSADLMMGFIQVFIPAILVMINIYVIIIDLFQYELLVFTHSLEFNCSCGKVIRVVLIREIVV